MVYIALHGAEFYAYHGFYPEEQKLGGHYLVDIEVGFDPGRILSEDNLTNTVNYERIYHIASEEMKVTRKLIETVAQAITDRIKIEYPLVSAISVTIKKNNPPLTGKVGHSAVTINYSK